MPLTEPHLSLFQKQVADQNNLIPNFMSKVQSNDKTRFGLSLLNQRLRDADKDLKSLSASDNIHLQRYLTYLLQGYKPRTLEDSGEALLGLAEDLNSYFFAHDLVGQYYKTRAIQGPGTEPLSLIGSDFLC